jgi:uncharacterized membrane protein
MKFWIAAALVLAVATGEAHSATLRCSFTEPFFSLTFTSGDGRLVMISADETDPDTGNPIPKTLAEGAKLQRDDTWQDVPQMRIVKGGETLLVVRLRTGSDGMSEAVFPFEGVYGGHVGGCETDKAPSYDGYEVWQDFGADP